MITPTQDIALQRWDILPITLREALFSEPNSDFLWKTCLDEHLPNENIYIVSKIAGYVLLGFLHPEDVGQEIKERIGIDVKTASAIEEALNKRIFTSLRTDIDKVYSPLSKLEPFSEKANPQILQDINIQSKIASTPIAPKPTTLSDIGWSKQPAAGSNIGASAIIPTPAPVPAPKLPAEPAPMMLHEDTTFKPAEKNVSFTLSKPGGAAEMSMNRGAAPAPTRPAVLEFGSATSAGTSVSKPPTPASSLARPMGFGPSFASMPTANIGTRNVSQIVPTVSAPIPKPPTPPIPPRPPQAPATSQPGKPIVKDFL